MDNLKIRRPEDCTKINLSQPWEVSFWCNELRCSETRLRNAVQAVGVLVVDVRRYLQSH